jgi:hypothetical protein
MLCAPLKLGVLKPAGASVVDFPATLTSPVPNAANSTKTQEEKRSFLPLGMIMSVPPRKTSVADARAGRRSTDRSQILRAVTERSRTTACGENVLYICKLGCAEIISTAKQNILDGVMVGSMSERSFGK